jgi:hypothetical protein
MEEIAALKRDLADAKNHEYAGELNAARNENVRLLAAIRKTVEAWDRHWQPGMKMEPDKLPNALRELRDILANVSRQKSPAGEGQP